MSSRGGRFDRKAAGSKEVMEPVLRKEEKGSRNNEDTSEKERGCVD